MGDLYVNGYQGCEGNHYIGLVNGPMLSCCERVYRLCYKDKEARD